MLCAETPHTPHATTDGLHCAVNVIVRTIRKTFLSCARPFACLDGATCLRRSTTRSKMRQDQHTRKTLAPARARPRWPRNPTSCSAPRAGRRAFRGSIALRSQLQARATQSILGGSGDTTKKRVTHIGVSSRYAGSEASAGRRRPLQRTASEIIIVVVVVVAHPLAVRWDEASPASGRSGWASVRYCRYLVPPLPVLENADGRPQVALIDVSAHQPLTVTARARVPPADARRGSSRPPPTTSMQAAACVARHRPCDLLPAS